MYNRAERYTINSANKISSHKWFQRIGKKLGTTSSNLTYATIETIIIYNAFLPFCWAPVNFICAISFIQFYRSWMKPNDENNNGNSGNNGNNGNNGNSNDKPIDNSNNNRNDRNNNSQHRMKLIEFLFDVKTNIFVLKPFTLSNQIKNIYNAFHPKNYINFY